MSVPRGYGTPVPVYSTKAEGPSGGGSAPKSILKRTVWRYIDFMKLYRGLGERDYAEMHTTFENADGSLIDQTVLDFQDEVGKEARARGMKSKDVIVEFEARAAAAGLPSATGVPPRFSGEPQRMPDLLMILVGRSA